jgi:hypothetical protein
LLEKELMHSAIPGICLAAGVWLLWVVIVIAAAVYGSRDRYGSPPSVLPDPGDLHPTHPASPSLHDNIKHEIYLCLGIEKALALRGVCRMFYGFSSPAVRWDAANRDNELNIQRVG